MTSMKKLLYCMDLTKCNADTSTSTRTRTTHSKNPPCTSTSTSTDANNNASTNASTNASSKDPISISISLSRACCARSVIALLVFVSILSIFGVQSMLMIRRQAPDVGIDYDGIMDVPDDHGHGVQNQTFTSTTATATIISYNNATRSPYYYTNNAHTQTKTADKGDTKINRKKGKKKSKSNKITKHTKSNRPNHNGQDLTDTDTTTATTDRHHHGRPLIDFAIVGFGKCGTTSLMNFLHIPDQIYMGFPYDMPDGQRKGREQCPDNPGEVRRLFDKYEEPQQLQTQPQPQPNVLRGFKCPSAIYGKLNVIENYQKMVAHPKLIVSVRHPVTHFQSAYNYFHANHTWPLNVQRPDPNDLIGHCKRLCKVHPGDLVASSSSSSSSPGPRTLPLFNDPHNRTCLKGMPGQKNGHMVCTSRSSMFHYGLSLLHLTPMTEEDEWDLLDHHRFRTMPRHYFNGTVFLMESTQLRDLSMVNSTRGVAMRDALGRFIGLVDNHSHTNTHNNSESSSTTLRHRPFPPKDSYEKLMDICHDDHEMLRKELVERGERPRGGYWNISSSRIKSLFRIVIIS